MDASGGWWDAGDYLKFVETTSYVVAPWKSGSLVPWPWAPAARSTSWRKPRFGIEWLESMWDDSTKTLYYQVGIGAGNANTVGDHDIWRLPQADDTLRRHQPADRYIRHRAGVRSRAPGSPVSPNLAGRRRRLRSLPQVFDRRARHGQQLPA